tara:strand:+ start:67 stop:468 length:402 start_codon:yes stop_codon:yes gene_type:complete
MGFLDKVRDRIIKNLDSELDKKLDNILHNPTKKQKKVAKEVADSLDELEKEYQRLGYGAPDDFGSEEYFKRISKPSPDTTNSSSPPKQTASAITPSDDEDVTEKLKKLHGLLKDGILDQDEFDKKKKELLDRL